MPRKRARAASGDWMSRLDEVREAGDRRASLTLLERFLAPETSDERRAEIAATLCALEDVRLAAPLRRTVLDLDLPADLRALALEVYATIPVDAPPHDEALAHCRSSDVVVRAFGVRALDVLGGDALAAAAGDPSPLVRYAAVDAMSSITRTAPLVAAARRAFRDEDAAIREAACRVALFDEPLAATHELIAALNDPSTAVRLAACDALEDFPRVAVLLALADARGDSEPGLAAELAFDGVVQRVRSAMAEMSPQARRRVLRWAEPVRWLLDEPSSDLLASSGLEDEPDDADAPGDEPRYDPVDVAEAASVLADDDAPPAAQRRLLVYRGWKRAGRKGLEVVRACAKSPNWSLRQGAAYAFADLGAAEDLVALASDGEPVVRRAAFEELRRTEEPGGLAAARETLADPAMRPIAGDDALALLVQLARPAEAERTVLAELARPDDRDGLWLGAIHLARRLEIESAVPHLRRIVEGPITSSVLPHVAAMSALRDLGKRSAGVALGHLESVDHLDVQRELGEWGWRGGRYS